MANKDIIDAILRGKYKPNQLTSAAPLIQPSKSVIGSKATGNPWETTNQSPWSTPDTGTPWQIPTSGQPEVDVNSPEYPINPPTYEPQEPYSPDKPSGLDMDNVAKFEDWVQNRLDKWLADSGSRMGDFKNELQPIMGQLEDVTGQYQDMALSGLLNVDDLVDQIKGNLSGDARNFTENATAAFRQQHAGRTGPYDQLTDTIMANKVAAPLQAQVASTVGKSKVELTQTNEQYKLKGMEGTQAALAQQNQILYALESMENSERSKYEQLAENYNQFLLTLDQTKQLTEAQMYQLWQEFSQQMAFNEKHAYDNQPSGGGFFDVVGGVLDFVSMAGSVIPGPWQAPSLAYRGINSATNSPDPVVRS